MEPITNPQNGLPIDYQLGDRIYKTNLYIENYIVKIEIYKPKGKSRKPTRKTVNRIFRGLGQIQTVSYEEAVERGYTPPEATKQD